MAQVLAELGRGDEVAVAERLKNVALAFVSAIEERPADGQLTDEGVAAVLEATSVAGEDFLAIALPIVEYGRHAALDALPRALRHIALATSAARTDMSAPRVAAVPALGRLVWALAAYALHCDWPAALVATARARVRVPFTDDDVQPVVALTELRYPQALGGNAGNSFNNYHEWLQGLALLERFPFFAADLEEAFLEGDLLLAMLCGRFRNRVYTGARTRDAVRRLAARVDDAAQREALEQLFPGEGDLQARLERAYAATEGDRNRFDAPPAHLFAREE